MLLKNDAAAFYSCGCSERQAMCQNSECTYFCRCMQCIFLQVYSNGWSGILKVVLGAAIPLILFGWLFALAMLGAGDLKLLMAVGVYTGPYGIVKVLLLALISGAVLALAF